MYSFKTHILERGIQTPTNSTIYKIEAYAKRFFKRKSQANDQNNDCRTYVVHPQATPNKFPIYRSMPDARGVRLPLEFTPTEDMYRRTAPFTAFLAKSCFACTRC